MRKSLLILLVLVAACSRVAEPQPARPAQAGKPLDPVETAARLSAARGAAAVGDDESARRQINRVNEDFRRSIKLADPSRAVDRESARQAAKEVTGVRSVAWLDRENLLAIVERNDLRSQATIDAICLRLEPLGDTLGVVVNLQSGAARNAHELMMLSRNCQLAPGDRALFQRKRSVDVLPPEALEQHKSNAEAAARDTRTDDAEETQRILESMAKPMQHPDALEDAGDSKDGGR